MNSLLFPDAARLPQLQKELCSFVSRLPVVAGIQSFGSFARNDWDRWSDLDFLVVTNTVVEFARVFANLQEFKEIVHHSFFTLRAEGDGAYVLGIVFADESIFHCLDLNFLTVAQVQVPGALQRFGPLQDLYTRGVTNTDSRDQSTLGTTADDATEKRINDAMYFTRKALKKVLRRQATLDELRPRAEYLTNVLRDYPEDILVPGGRIGYLAHKVLALTDDLLAGNS